MESPPCFNTFFFSQKNKVNQYNKVINNKYFKIIYNQYYYPRPYKNNTTLYKHLIFNFNEVKYIIEIINDINNSIGIDNTNEIKLSYSKLICVSL